MGKTAKEKLNRVWEWLKKDYALLLAPLFVAILYLIALISYGVYPFGKKYTVASYDLSAQIAPFIEHLFDAFDKKSTLTFSYAVVGGADVTGTFLYFFISPFSFLFLIFGDGKVAHASSIVMLCKLTAIAFAGAWFAKKLFSNIPQYLCLAVGVTYAYCGYTFVSNTYINWMDFLIYMPFTAAAFVRFVKTGKLLAFSLLVACNIYTCFSIACFSLFTVFPTLVGYGVLCVNKEERGIFITKLCLSFFVAICLALPVLFPALGAYSVSGRGGSLFENLWKGFAVNEQTGALGEFNSSTFLNSYGTSLYRKWSYIFADGVFVILTFAWFLRKGLKDKFAQFMLLAAVTTLLPCLVDEAMNLLNMGSYMSYALRFGFLNALYFLGGACLCLDGISFKPLTAYDGAPVFELEEKKNEGGMYASKGDFFKNNTRPLLWAGILILLGVIALAFLLWFTVGDNYLTFLKLFGVDGESFSGRFAHSLGGFEVIIVLFLVLSLVAFVGCFFVADKKVSPRLLSYVLVSLVCVQVCFYNNQLVAGNCSTGHRTMESYQAINEVLNEREDGYFRVKDYDDTLTACAPFTTNCNSFSVFSSVIDKDNFQTLQLFGYKGNGKNTFKSAHNTDKYNRSDEFGDAFLGYKYFISEKEDLHKRDLTKTYLRPVYRLDEQGKVLLDEKGEKVRLVEGGLYVYENTIVFPLGYRVEGSYSFAAENIGNSHNRKANQAELYKFLRGEDLQEKTGRDFVTPSSAAELNEYLRSKAADVQVSAGKITANVTAEEGESLLLNFVAARGYSVTVNGKKAELVENDLKFLLVELEEGENEVAFSYRSPYGGYALLGLASATVLLFAVWAILRWTKVVEKAAPVVTWTAVVLAVAIVAFFMVYPTGVFIAKVIELIKLFI